MKKLYLIGNHKMNMNYSELKSYYEDLKIAVQETKNVVGVCVPSVYLDLTCNALKNTNILFGAQNLYYKNSGAFTGEISAPMLNDFNCNMVIIGHSERRTLFSESNNDINLKLKKALEFGLTPILCFGENLSIRESGEVKQFVKNQLASALDGLSAEQVNKIMFAYEPIWAIGTGVNATPEQAEEIAEFSKAVICDLYNDVIKENIILLYGGSLKPSNALEILSKPNINGGLIGGASLKVEDFKGIFNVIVE